MSAVGDYERWIETRPVWFPQPTVEEAFRAGHAMATPALLDALKVALEALNTCAELDGDYIYGEKREQIEAAIAGATAT